MSYFVYLINNNFTIIKDTDQQIDTYDAIFEISDALGIIASAPGANIRLDNGTLTITPAIPVIEETITSNIITKREFLKRFTPEEYAAIRQATVANAMVDYFWQMFILSEEVDLLNQDTAYGINMLEQAGLLAQGRAMEILS